MSSAPRAVIVTGGGTGIGRAVAGQLVAAGDQVAIFGRRADVLRSAAEATGAAGVVCDVSDADQVASCVAAVAKAALPHLLRQRGRLVVAVASVAALRASNQMGGYAVTKAGLAMLTQSLAVDHAHQGLRANVVCPGWTVTEMGDEEMAEFGASRGGLGVDEAYELATSLVPQRRAASAAEVAAVVCWLLSDAASYVNGAVIPVDGAGIAVDVGTVPYDPRVQIRRQYGS